MKDVQFEIPKSDSNSKEILRNLDLMQAKKTVQVETLNAMPRHIYGPSIITRNGFKDC